MKKLLTFILLVSVCALVFAQDSIPKSKQTDLGLYINSKNAFERWKANPEKVKILDVRTIGEYAFVGHAPMAVNVPFLFLDGSYDSEGNKFNMSPNENFAKDVESRFAKTDTIFVTCRSGGRSARATNVLAKDGYKFVYSIFDGFEGDAVKDENSYFKGKRVLNGWKNSSAPWTYELDKDKVYKK